MKNKKHKRRLRNLVFIVALMAILISVSTYAWFIGMRTVNVTSFDVEISTTESLMLSLDGEHWSTTLDINGANWATVGYAGNTNTWGGDGLTPVSSVGVVDPASSRLELYEKSSFTAVPGGYRIMASQVPNTDYDEPEPSGYVAFDLFIKNFSGRQYLSNYNTLDEEAIYLTAENDGDNDELDSKVVVAANALAGGSAVPGGVVDTGIENSVRVAFAQIARIAGTETDPEAITSIKCNGATGTVTAGVTSICRTASIWEPNDTDHTENALKWYDKTCIGRKNTATDGEDVTKAASYTGSCATIADGDTVPTYVINDEIASGDHVNLYDGEAYNGYTKTTKLESFPYFTDTMKEMTSINRQELFTLAPNSITKVRVYIWIEGQDIDNYDFASIGRQISIAFGFTKERYTSWDTDYTGPALTDTKTTKPKILYNGTAPTDNRIDSSASVSATAKFDYMEGITAVDDLGEGFIDDLTRKIIVEGTVDLSTADTYYVRYLVSDWWGNYATAVTRKVVVS